MPTLYRDPARLSDHGCDLTQILFLCVDGFVTAGHPEQKTGEDGLYVPDPLKFLKLL